jgi:hypothetical protein
VVRIEKGTEDRHTRVKQPRLRLSSSEEDANHLPREPQYEKKKKKDI